MNSDSNRNLLAVAAVAAAVMGAVVMVHLGNMITPVGGVLPWNPVVLLIQVMRGAVDWPPAATWLVTIELVAAMVALLVWGTHAPSKTQEAARRMSPAGRITTANSRSSSRRSRASARGRSSASGSSVTRAR